MNLLAYIVGVVVLMVLGYLWYGPWFGKTWMSLLGLTPEKMEGMKKGMSGKYAVQIIGALLMVFVLYRAILVGGTYENLSGIGAGLHFAFWNWLGFIAPVTVGMVLWEGKPWKYWFIVAGYWLVGLCLVGALLAVW